MKRFRSAVILIATMVFMLYFSTTATAKTTTLHLSIPKQVTVIVQLSGHGKVSVNGQTLTNSGSILINRLDDVKVLVSANMGNSLSSVEINGNDFTEEVKNGSLVIENIQFDTNLSVVFTPNTHLVPENNPWTGDLTPFFAYLLCSVISIILLLHLAHITYKKRYKT